MKNILLAILAILCVLVACYIEDDAQVERDVSGRFDHPPSSFPFLPKSAPYNP